MINGIGNSNGYQGYLQTQSMRPKPPDAAQMFGKLDTDGDGKLSQTELDTWAGSMAEKTGATMDTSEALTTYDSDGDGGLSSDEMQAFVSATMQQGIGGMGMMQGPPPPSPEGMGLFGALDTDGSGGVSGSELSTWATNMSEETGATIDTSEAISTFDTDADGELSETELKSFLDPGGIKPPSAKATAQTDDSTDETGSTSTASGIVSKYDTDGDGVLSATELQAYLDDRDASYQNFVQKALALYQSLMGGSDGSSSLDYCA
ncbi:MAG TPA: EF-hand domain-containing protein [Deltaproteobacteria bacterium]|nr:EF-hand domain-containing protein [Deltaproteobacteria bacterium]